MAGTVAAERSFFYRFGRTWELLLDLLAVMRPMRFPILVLIATSFLLIVVQPAQDALLVMVTDAIDPTGWHAGGLGRFALFVACWFFWAFSTFYAARFMSRLPPRGRIAYLDVLAQADTNPFHIYPPPRLRTERAEELNVTVPRALGGAVLVATAAALIHAIWGTADVGAWILVIATSIMLLAVYAITVRKRRSALNWIARRLSMTGQVQPLTRDIPAILDWPSWCRPLVFLTGLAVLIAFLASAWTDARVLPPALTTVIVMLGTLACLCVCLVVLSAWRGIPIGTRWFIACLLALTTALLILSLWPRAPIAVQWLRSPVVVVLSAAGWAASGTFLLALPAEITGFPIVGSLLVVAVLSSLVSLYDNHSLRLAGPVSGQAPVADRRFEPASDAACPTLSASPDALARAFARWCAVAIQHRQPGRALPLVIVATAGGASRAAYWTMVVLGSLEASYPDFHDDVFAISSVSGGSLGSMIYRLSLDLNAPAAARKRPLLDMLKQDFLGSLLLGAAYADLCQRVLPGSLLPDRAAALETAWEVQWEKMATRSFPQDAASGWMRNGFIQQMNRFMQKPGAPQWRPIMLLNGTSALTGRRIITSNMPIGAGFPIAYDFYDSWRPRDIRVSTAVHNSARFPYLDAAGDILNGRGATVDRIVDGGYFENNGAATAVDLLEQLIDRGAFRQTSDPTIVSVMPVVIQITNDPTSPNAQPLGTPTSPRTDALGWRDRVLADATVPIAGFYDIRAGLGERATEALRRRLAFFGPANTPSSPPDDSRYFEFGIWDQNIPMSWLLSERASTLIDNELPTGQPRPVCDPKKLATAACNVMRFQKLVALLRTGVQLPAAADAGRAQTSTASTTSDP